MTAPTQPPDPRAKHIHDLQRAIAPCSDGDGNADWHLASEIVRVCNALIDGRAAQAQPSGKAGELDTLARVLVEELGGREENEPVEKADPRIAGWMEVCTEIFKLFPTMHTDMRQIPVHSRQAAAIRQLAAQQRENADTIKALRERAEVAERATAELDAQRKSAEQSARDLRENNATLRAELDAITGAQVPYRWAVVDKEGMSFTFTSLEKAQAWAIGDRGEVVPLYTHPAPALPVVGACLVRGKEITVVTQQYNSQAACEDIAVTMATRYNGTAHQLLLGAPLTTEGGK